MENDVDLRIYMSCVIRHWRLIAGLTVATTVIALLVAVFWGPAYEATAIVVLTRPLYQFQFSSSIQSLDTGSVQALLNGKTALDLANSDTVLQQLLVQVGADLPPEDRSPSRFKEMLTVSAGKDPTVIKLTAKNSNPQLVAQIANTWADLYIHHINNLYGQSAEKVSFFDNLVTPAENDLNTANQTLVDFQNRNGSAVLQAQLTAKQNALASYLSMNESLKLLLQNVHSLRDQLGRQPADATSALGDDLAVLSLQISAFNAQSDIPIQLQLPSTGTLSSKTVGQQITFLSNLARTIEDKQLETTKQTDQLPSEIMALQGKIQETKTEEAQLTRQRDLAQAFYTSLTQKAQETRIAVQDTSGLARLASNAAVPDRPIGGKLRTTVLGAILGLVIGVGIAFAIDYLKPFVSNVARPMPATGK